MRQENDRGGRQQTRGGNVWVERKSCATKFPPPRTRATRQKEDPLSNVRLSTQKRCRYKALDPPGQQKTPALLPLATYASYAIYIKP
jgi:hypothetical protein